MQSLKKLAQNLEKESQAAKTSTMFDRHPSSKPFLEKFPVIIESVSPLGLDLEIVVKESQDEQNRKTNVKAHMTHWFMHKENKAYEFIADRAIEIAKKNGPHPIELVTYDCWGAIYRKGDYTIMHNHWPHLWSFVYYVKSEKKSSPLIFDNAPQGSHYIWPKTNDMVIFPAWLNHSVPKHNSSQERIVISGNLMMNTKL